MEKPHNVWNEWMAEHGINFKNLKRMQKNGSDREYIFQELPTEATAIEAARNLSGKILDTLFLVIVRRDNINADPFKFYVGEAWTVGYYRGVVRGFHRGKEIII